MSVTRLYGCGTFDARGLCDNCRKKISDLKEGKVMCPFGAYPIFADQLERDRTRLIQALVRLLHAPGYSDSLENYHASQAARVLLRELGEAL